MKEILSPAKAVEKLCGALEEKQDATYRLTRHCIRVGCGDGELFYHTLTGELILIEAGETIDAHRGALVRKRFLVPEGFDENGYSDDVHRLAALLAPHKGVKNDFTVFTTTDCNARCFYCYEKGRRRIPMSEEVARDAAAYIAEACRGEDVRLRWFGGEPLYNIPAIDTITSGLKSRGVAITSSMTSNGFYLTEDVARRAVSVWNLQNVQITVDGTEKVYNRTKAYIDDCENPFARVLDNIEGALDAGIKVFIRLNVDSGNAADMSDAVDLLGRRFQGRDNVKIIIALLRSFAGKVHEFESEEDAAGCYFRLAEKIRSYGLFREKELFRDLAANRWMADSDRAEVILPDGRVGKCEHFSESELVGSIYSPERDRDMLKAWKERTTAADMPECADCPLYPKCISLKKCEWTANGCPKSVRIIRTENTKRALLFEYEKYKIKVRGTSK